MFEIPGAHPHLSAGGLPDDKKIELCCLLAVHVHYVERFKTSHLQRASVTFRMCNNKCIVPRSR